VYERSDNEEPISTKLNALMPEPKLLMFLMDMVEPIDTKFRIEIEEPICMLPKMEKLDLTWPYRGATA
jgi:hypothetical protein